MPRRPRLDMAGYHHVVNRGVAKSEIYQSADDKEKFLEILCKACRDYRVTIHDYCLMDNHYHLLLETERNNLSSFMRQINANYAIYFNKKYKRTGHLWQGRFKSWYIVEETYLYTLFRYIEHNPIGAGISRAVGEYPYTLLATAMDTHRSVIPCAQNSKLLQEITYEGIMEHMQMSLSQDDMAEIKQIQKKKIVLEGDGATYERAKTLEEHFEKAREKEERNEAVMRALDDGYRQAEVARYLKLTPAAIAKIKKAKS